MDGCVSIPGWNFFPALIPSLSTLLSFCNPQHGYFPLYRQRIQRKLLIWSPISCLHSFSPLQPSAQYSTSKIWYSGCRRVSSLIELQPGVAIWLWAAKTGKRKKYKRSSPNLFIIRWKKIAKLFHENIIRSSSNIYMCLLFHHCHWTLSVKNMLLSDINIDFLKQISNHFQIFQARLGCQCQVEGSGPCRLRSALPRYIRSVLTE